MSNSSNEGKLWTKEKVQGYLHNVPDPQFLDIGTGQGTYYRLFNQYYPNAKWTGVEGYKPYIEGFKLREKYDVLHHADARELYGKNIDISQLHYHVVFCGDVLEHMTKEEAITLVEKLKSACGILIISIPIIKWPQHDESNPFQIHVKDDWSHQEVMASFTDITAFFVGSAIGVYIVAGDRFINKGI
jgi:2-polyprenyl-3-methyl-5-hydroxy-6-metoxy-1,4-benzoquinol methylase